MTEMPAEVTDVQRLRLRPGDTLVIRVGTRVSQQDADRIIAKVRAKLGLDESTPILVLPEGGSVEVIGTTDTDERLISRAVDEAQAHPGKTVTVSE